MASTGALTPYKSRPVAAMQGTHPSINTPTTSTGAGTAAVLPRPVQALSAAVVFSTGSSTGTVGVTFQGSLEGTKWTTLKSTAWTSTQDGVVRAVGLANTPVTYVRAVITGHTGTRKVRCLIAAGLS